MNSSNVAKGKASLRREGPGACFDYVEEGRAWSGEWDPRNTGAFFPMMTTAWDEPANLPMDAAARDRLYDAVWALNGGPDGLLEEHTRFSFWVAMRWKRAPDGFLVNILGREVQYMELGRTLRIPARMSEGPTYEAVVAAVPTEWTLPEGEPVPAEHLARIVERVRHVGPKDMWLGANYSWKVTVDVEGVAT
jgi:hypothetical protein